MPQQDSRRDIKRYFARKLNDLMAQRGWNQTETAREISRQLPEGKKPIGRDVVNVWANAGSMPRDVNLRAIAKAFGVDPSELLPAGMLQAQYGERIPVRVEDGKSGDRARLQLDVELPWEAALEVMRIIKQKQIEDE